MGQEPLPPPQPLPADPWRMFLPLVIGAIAVLVVLPILGIVVANMY